jgi:predicted phage terminase large subunit-like protein
LGPDIEDIAPVIAAVEGIAELLAQGSGGNDNRSWQYYAGHARRQSYSVCTTWGMKSKDIYLLHVLRRRMEYPDLKRAVREQAARFHVRTVLIEDKSSGAQVIQELRHEGLHGVTRYEPKMHKVMRLHSVTSMIENGFVYVPEKAE